MFPVEKGDYDLIREWVFVLFMLLPFETRMESLCKQFFRQEVNSIPPARALSYLVLYQDLERVLSYRPRVMRQTLSEDGEETAECDTEDDLELSYGIRGPQPGNRSTGAASDVVGPKIIFSSAAHQTW